MFEVLLATVGVLALLSAASTELLVRSPVTPPMVALTLGVALGPVGLGVVQLDDLTRPGVLETAAQLLLAVALMASALRYPLGGLRPLVRPLAWLLLVALPLMGVTVALLGVAALGVGLPLALALGAVLAPTDPVLATGVAVGRPAERWIPDRMRQLLTIESGANDGLVLPFALAAAALASGVAAGGSVVGGLVTGLGEVLVGVVVGGLLGAGGAWLLRVAEAHRDIEESGRLLYTLVLAVAVLGVTALVHGNAILGVFAAGLAHNWLVHGPDRTSEADIDQGMNQILVLPMFVLIGAVLPWQGWAELGLGGAAFVVGVLVLRRLPWLLLLQRPLGLRPCDAAWLGWFGPIGVATTFYLALLHRQGVTDPLLWHAGSLVVVASTLVHGATSTVGWRAYRRRTEGAASG